MGSRERRVVYLDSSAIVKLVVREAETDAVHRYVAEAEVVASEIVNVEVPRAAHLKTGAPETTEHAEALLRRFYLVPIDDALYRAAARVRPPGLRSIDAIHLASALRLRQELYSLVAYDRRLVRAAEEAGLRVEMPADGA